MRSSVKPDSLTIKIGAYLFLNRTRSTRETVDVSMRGWLGFLASGRQPAYHGETKKSGKGFLPIGWCHFINEAWSQ
jgi:hypothetical protein